MQEWKEKIRIVRGRLAWASLPLCFCGLVLFDAALRFFYRAAGSTRFLDWRAFVFTGAWSLLLTGAAALLPPLGRRIAMGVYAVFFGLLSVVHGVMFNIFGEFFTFSDTNFAGDGAKFFSLSYLNLRKALVASIVLAMLLLAVGAWLVPKRQPGKPRWPRLAGASGAILLSLVSVVLLNRSLLPQADTMTWGSLFDPSSEEQAYKDFTDSNRCLLLAGLYQYTVRDFVVSFGLEASPVDLNSLDQFYEERAGQVSGENEYTGLYEGKSLLMVMLESIDTWLLTPEYMPNLYALQQQGTNFVHNYTPLFLSAGTFNTEFISQTGLLPSVTGLSSSIYSTNSFPFSLAHQFSQQGYTVGSFHTASAGIYSRGSIHQNLGMTYHSGAEMGMDDYMLDSQMMEGQRGRSSATSSPIPATAPILRRWATSPPPTGKPPRQRWPSPAWNPPQPIWKSTPTPWPTPWRRTSSSASWWPSWRPTAAWRTRCCCSTPTTTASTSPIRSSSTS